MLTPESFEQDAREARRRADIAKHVPIEQHQLDTYGEEIESRNAKCQTELLKRVLEVQKTYCEELTAAWGVAKVLRAEALYWQQKYEKLRYATKDTKE